MESYSETYVYPYSFHHILFTLQFESLLNGRGNCAMEGRAGCAAGDGVDDGVGGNVLSSEETSRILQLSLLKMRDLRDFCQGEVEQVN
jgi:hypothetical protein